MHREPQDGESDLIRSFLDGDRDAHRAIDSWIDTVLHDGFGSIRDQWDDIRQDARMRVFGNLREERFDGASSLRTYVHSIATNAAIDRLRSTYRDRRGAALAGNGAALGAAASPDHGPLVMARELLHRLLGGLSAKDRALVDMIFAQDLAYAEVARRLGISEAAVKLRVFRCRSRLLKRRRSLLRSDGLSR